jgi:uncharacterized protein
MTRYQLAKIVQGAGSFRSRKRMQKLVFLLQAAGCPLDAEFSLHRYGPYSHDVAQLTAELVHEGLLTEDRGAHPYGEEYSYQLSEEARRQLAEYEAEPSSSHGVGELARFWPLASKLYSSDLKQLEVASTIAFFRKQGYGWPDSVAKTCAFKQLPADSPLLEASEQLARQIVA